MFQRVIYTLLKDVPGVYCYLDDILVNEQNQEEHDTRLCLVLQTLRGEGFHLNMGKCHFTMPFLTYLGHVIGTDGSSPKPSLVQAILSVSTPDSPQKLKSFLRLRAYYGQFIPNFVVKVSPLRKLLQKVVEFYWDCTCDDCFIELKQAIVSSPALALFDPNAETIVLTDASQYGIGGVLPQVCKDQKTIAFAPQTLSGAERMYSVVENEAVACVFAVEHWKTYLWGQKF